MGCNQFCESEIFCFFRKSFAYMLDATNSVPLENVTIFSDLMNEIGGFQYELIHTKFQLMRIMK